MGGRAIGYRRRGTISHEGVEGRMSRVEGGESEVRMGTVGGHSEFWLLNPEYVGQHECRPGVFRRSGGAEGRQGRGGRDTIRELQGRLRFSPQSHAHFLRPSRHHPARARGCPPGSGTLMQMASGGQPVYPMWRGAVRWMPLSGSIQQDAFTQDSAGKRGGYT